MAYASIFLFQTPSPVQRKQPHQIEYSITRKRGWTSINVLGNHWHSDAKELRETTMTIPDCYSVLLGPHSPAIAI